MNEPIRAVQEFFDRMQSRDWTGARELVAPTATIRFTHTGELFEGEGFVAMNEAYPEGWSIHVEDILGQGNRVAAHVRVDHGDDLHWCAGFYQVEGGRIVSGVEHWVTADSATPPRWRSTFRSTG